MHTFISMYEIIILRMFLCLRGVYTYDDKKKKQ